MMQCTICKRARVSPARVELGYEHCIKCAHQEPRLARPTCVVIGQHKGPPLVLALHDPIILHSQNTMNR